MAQHYPERNFLGVERLLGRVRGVCKRIQELGLTNVMVLRLESQYTLEYLLAPASVSRLHLLCPDPGPKPGTTNAGWCSRSFSTFFKRLSAPAASSSSKPTTPNTSSG